MKKVRLGLFVGVLCWAGAAQAEKSPQTKKVLKKKPETRKTIKNVYSFSAKNIEGKEVPLSKYTGKVLLIVNTASRCGYTPQYAGLQKLYKKYKSKGFVVLAFPANNFGSQEPGTDKQIKNFCSSNYKITFPLFSKISVKGKDKHPLYQHLTDPKNGFGGDVTWNFNKFLVNRVGRVVGRFESSVSPLSAKLKRAIQKSLRP